MATLRAVALLTAVLVAGAASGANPAASRDAFAGTTWHTVRIHGDALFFFIRDVGVRFEDGGRFVAAVRYIDGQQATRTGTYRIVKPGVLRIAIDGLGPPKELRYRRQGTDLVVQDRAFDVTVRFAPGKIEEERWF
jgi:hypothetical protein